MNFQHTIMKDGSRLFIAFMESLSFQEMRDHISKLAGTSITEFITDDVTEVWIDFDYKDNHFTINNQFGEYWFFVRDPHCPETVLDEIASHCEQKLGSPTWWHDEKRK